MYAASTLFWNQSVFEGDAYNSADGVGGHFHAGSSFSAQVMAICHKDEPTLFINMFVYTSSIR